MNAERTVLLVEDDAMVRGWLRLALQSSAFRLAGEAETAAGGLDLVERRRPDVLLVDYRLPDQVGTEFVRELRRRGDHTPAVLMTANDETGFNEGAREAGAQATVLKTGSADDIVAALEAAVAGFTSYDARHSRRSVDHAALSPREREALKLVAAGATNRVVAEQLGVSDETVKTMLARSFAKLGVSRRAEAVSRAHQLGLL